MGKLEVPPGFGETVCVCEREHVHSTHMLQASIISAAKVFPACLYMTKPQLEAKG